MENNAMEPREYLHALQHPQQDQPLDADHIDHMEYGQTFDGSELSESDKRCEQARKRAAIRTELVERLKGRYNNRQRPEVSF